MTRDEWPAPLPPPQAQRHHSACKSNVQCREELSNTIRKTNVPRDLEWKKGYSREMEIVWTLKTQEAKKHYGESKRRNRCTCRCR